MFAICIRAEKETERNSTSQRHAHTFENVNLGLSGMNSKTIAQTKLGRPHDSK